MGRTNVSDETYETCIFSIFSAGGNSSYGGNSFLFQIFQVLHFTVAFQMCTGKVELMLCNTFEQYKYAFH